MQREKKLKKKQNIQELQDNFYRYNICIIEIPEGKIKENRSEEILK